MRSILLLSVVLIATSTTRIIGAAVAENGDFITDDQVVEARNNELKCHLWSKGAFDLDLPTNELEDQLVSSYHRLGPIRKGRVGECHKHRALNMRGGDVTATSSIDIDVKLAHLTQHFGPKFAEAIQRNKKEHAADCQKSCEHFYCANKILGDAINWNENNSTTIKSYSFGGLPPEDFAQDFGFPLDLMKVTENHPLFSAEESAEVIRIAKEEGVDNNEYQSGKYKLGGDWLTNLPQTRAWFNMKLEQTFFPLLHELFPEIVSSASVLRAHSVSLLKYNNTHPRTDVHIDNGVLAMTLAMTPQSEYTGGGTFYEHFGADNVLPMDVGHGTFRPGSVRHGGHRVTQGVRFILGAFLLIEDRVEHVRRLKNRGSELRNSNDLAGAVQHFEWALAINPKCSTCLKDWSEILQSQQNFVGAEKKMRQVLELLDNQDSDALFSLGVLLSEQGRDDESIEAYKQSLALNAEDSELCFNLGVKLGIKGNFRGEMAMYAKATSINPKMGKAWMNMGIGLAEAGNLDESEVMFLKALLCETEIRPQALANLALLFKERGTNYVKSGDFAKARDASSQAGAYLDEAKPLFDALVPLFPNNRDLLHYANGFEKLRSLIFRISGTALLQLKEFAACEDETRRMTDMFPGSWESWAMLSTVLQYCGKSDEAVKCQEKATQLRGVGQ